MNKKQKILTIVALVVFTAIIGLHYVGFEPPGRRLMTVQEFFAWRASPQGKAVDFAHLPGKKFDATWDTIDFQRTHSPEIKHGWYLKTEAYWVIIKDVRLPIFALAVFYAGLLFILGGKRPPRD